MADTLEARRQHMLQQPGDELHAVDGHCAPATSIVGAHAQQHLLAADREQDLNLCQAVARSFALVHKWCGWYCRAAQRTGRLQAITSHPLLLAAVGKTASHANQTTLYLTPLHGRADVLKRLVANISAALRHVRATAEQFKDLDRWGCLLRYIATGSRRSSACQDP